MASTLAALNPPSEKLIDLIAQRFRVLGEPMRIKLLCTLAQQPATVGELREITGGTQQNVSKHLGVLAQAGVVERQKRGTCSVYSIADDTVFAMCDQVCGALREQTRDLDGLLQDGINKGANR